MKVAVGEACNFSHLQISILAKNLGEVANGSQIQKKCRI